MVFIDFSHKVIWINQDIVFDTFISIIRTKETPSKLFEKYAYDESKFTTPLPIAVKVLNKIKKLTNCLSQ